MITSDIQAINKAMMSPEEYALQLRYTDKEGVVTERMVSPIRFINEKSVLCLCLCRETPRRFDLDRCSGIQLVAANDVLMPVEIKVIHEPDTTVDDDTSDHSSSREVCRPD